MAANANFAVAIEIHSHHNEFKMRYLLNAVLNSNRAFQKEKKKGH